jgi:archaellum component FlaF (FlaF/FlaG flagellin family)
MAGSVTETGNVTGRIIIKDSDKGVGNVKINLFRQETAVLSPINNVVPEAQTISDNNGNFSFEVSDGMYTIVASGKDGSAFVPEVIASSDQTDLYVTLEKPGTIRGEITNALELHNSGSIIVHLLGTDIYRNVDNSGKFIIDSVPAGLHTLVSYSTYLPDFSPDYRNVTITSDSVNSIAAYNLDYNGIPIPRNVTLQYDTSIQTVSISWHPVTGYADFQEYEILRGVAGSAQHNLVQIAYTTDTIYKDHFPLALLTNKRYEYAVRVNNKFGLSGQYYGIYSIAVEPFIKDYGLMPSSTTQQSDIVPYVTRFGGKYWYLSGTRNEPYGVWASDSMSGWKLISSIQGPNNGSSLIAFKGSLYILNLEQMLDGTGLKTVSKSYRSSNGSDWNEITISPPPPSSAVTLIPSDSSGMDSARYDSFYLKSRIVELNGNLYAVLSVSIYHGDHGSILQCLITSSDGANWKFASLAPVGDYRFNYDLVTSGNDLYFVSHPAGLRYTEKRNSEIYQSTNGGLSWKRTGLWDSDYETTPDDIFFLTASDSVLFTSYTTNPGDVNKESVYYKGVWTVIPSTIFSDRNWFSMGPSTRIDGKELFWINTEYHLLSVNIF